MTTINTATKAPQTVLEKTAQENSAAAIQDRFYTLLITQMKNQDPLNPMDNSQVTSQMAQLSTLTGIEKMNVSLGALGASMRTSMISQASSVLGRSVVAEGRIVDVADETGMFVLNAPAETAKLEIDVIDTATGKIAKTITKTDPEIGYNKFDIGALPDGRYRLQYRALDAEGEAVEGASSLVQSRVTSLIPDGDDIVLTLSNGETTTLRAIQQLSVA